jgi:hypothetical protein
MELFIHNKISEEQTLWWNLYSITSLLIKWRTTDDGDRRWMPSNGKSSVSLWPCELKQNRNGYFKKFLFLNLFSPWYSRQIAELNNNHSLTHIFVSSLSPLQTNVSSFAWNGLYITFFMNVEHDLKNYCLTQLFVGYTMERTS